MNAYIYGAFGFVVLALSGFSYYQNITIQRLEFLRTCSDERSRINNDQLQENLINMISDLRTQTVESAKNQGKIEGIITAVNNMKLDDGNEYNAIWHSGYYAGANTSELQIAVAYEEGYHKATEDGHCTGKNTGVPTENIFPAANKNQNKDITNKPISNQTKPATENPTTIKKDEVKKEENKK
jgi:hypothetical protein